jgi:hypothetical protein
MGQQKGYSGSDSGKVKGSRNTKTPTGARPVPQVAHSSLPPTNVPGPVKAPIKRKGMPTPKMDAGRNKPRQEGGR